MTWHYAISDDYSQMEIYDDNGNLFTTLENNGGGFTPKKDVLQAIEEAALDEFQQSGFSPRLMSLLRDAIFENIEEGAP